MIFKIENSKTPEILSGFDGVCLGNDYGATSQYLTKNGVPYICRMGEFHFSRYNENHWEEELIKMRDGGIDVIASYVFWIHHEEDEGVFRFDGNRDIKKFVKLCKKLNLPFVMRIGPWAHGEARNGGFPDWLDSKCNGVTRTDSEPYLSYVKRFFEKLYEEVKDDKDAILGIQIENEHRRGRDYIVKLKNMLKDMGFNVPYWTFTGWGGSDSPESHPVGAVLLLYGGYPEAPWLEHVNPYYGSHNYLFSKERDDNYIGADLFGKDNDGRPLEKNKTLYKVPFLTCELGGGNQVTYHRRPTIIPDDILAIAICKMGNGANGLGYYVYHGGVNPVNKTTTQESRETGYPNDLPIISYDFQAPLGDAGQIRESYFVMKNIHNFVEYKGYNLAPMTPFFPDIVPKNDLDTETLRCSVRSDGKSGYLFVLNHYHGGVMKEVSDVVEIKLPDSTLKIPVTIAPSGSGIIPFNYPVGDVTADYIKALPQGETEDTLIFSVLRGIKPEISINRKVFTLENNMEIGGKKIVLKFESYPEKTKGEEIALPSPRVTDNNLFFGHIVNYDGTKPEFSPVNEYNFTLPDGTKYLKIEALGNIGALYQGDKLISDFYLYLDKWVVDTRELSGEVTLKILPLTQKDREKIMFEIEMPCGNFTPTVYAIKDDIVYI